MNLPIPVKKSLAFQNISTPTPIQSQAIPHALDGKDVIGLAQTGTGKTLAFCLPLIATLDKEENKNATALILAPTREIAIQVTEVIKLLTEKMTGRWHPVLVIGGVGMQPQVDGLSKEPRMIIATPGRLVDHMRSDNAHLGEVRFLVLDEADRMLDMGFAPQLNEILRGLSTERQTMLFSATFPKEIEDISQKYLRSPVRVEAGEGHSRPVSSVTQVVKELLEDEKFPALNDAIKEREGNIIVFVRTKHRADRISRQLEKAGHSAGRIHGDRSQSQRQKTLSDFREGSIRILVATDIAARGIDVAGVSHVINFDIPNVPEEYIHRIGRTGRAGLTGESLSFVTPHVKEEWRAILKLIDPELYAKTPHVPNVERPVKPDSRPPRHGGPRHDRGGDRQERPHRNERPSGRHDRNDRNDRRDRPHRGDRPNQHGRNHQQRPPARGSWGPDGPTASNQPQNISARNEDLTDDLPQPTLEEQLSRIDREAKRQRMGHNNRRPADRRPGPPGRRPHRQDSGASSRPQRQSQQDGPDDDDNIGNR